MKVLFITPPDASPGFAVAGADQRMATPERLAEILVEAQKDEAIGLIAVDERLLKDAGSRPFRGMDAAWKGVFVVLPPPEAVCEVVEEYLQSLIRRAIGYQVRITP